MRCNCENSECPHGAAACPNEATGEHRIMYVGDVCKPCFDRMPEQYRRNEGPGDTEEELYGKLFDLLTAWGPERLCAESARGAEALKMAGNRGKAAR